MIAVGFVSLAFGLIFLYIYVAHVKTGKKPRKLRQAANLRALQRKGQEELTDGFSIKDVRPGGVVRLEGVGMTSESFDVHVKARHLHKHGAERWVELEADRGGTMVYLTLQEDDGLYITATLAQPPLTELALSREKFSRLLEQSSPSLSYDGAEFSLSEQGSALFCRNHDELQPEPYSYWEFESAEGAYLTIVRWQDGNLEANFSVDVDPTLITVYSTS